jgi:hypothetical protein
MCIQVARFQTSSLNSTHAATVIKDSKPLIDELIFMNLPTNAKLFTADTASMYCDIELNHDMQIIQHWIETPTMEYYHQDFKPETIQAILKGLNLVMTYKIMQFEIPFSSKKLAQQWAHNVQLSLL